MASAESPRHDRPESRSGPSSESLLADARHGCAESRWRVLADCRDYLRFVVRQGSWSRPPAVGRTSDLVQRTVVDAWRKFSGFQGSDDRQLRGWVKAILINAVRNDRRGAGRLAAIDARRLDELADRGPAAESAAAAVDRAEQVAEALSALGGRDQTVIRLRIWDELGFAEVGRRLGVSEDAARMQFARALDRLRKQLRHADGIG